MNLLDSLRDPRYYQVAVLASLLTFGIAVLDFGIRWQNAAAILLTALVGAGMDWFGNLALTYMIAAMYVVYLPVFFIGRRLSSGGR